MSDDHKPGSARYLSPKWFEIAARKPACSEPIRGTIHNVIITGECPEPIVREYSLWIDADGMPNYQPSRRSDAELTLAISNYQAWTEDYLAGTLIQTYTARAILPQGDIAVGERYIRVAQEEPCRSALLSLRRATFGNAQDLADVDDLAGLDPCMVLDEQLESCRTKLPMTMEVLEDQVRNGRFLGAQLYVSFQGDPVADVGIGVAGPGRPMQNDMRMPLLCCAKPLTAIAIVRLWEQGRLDLNSRVADFVPEFGEHGKAGFSVLDLLTHMTPIDQEPTKSYPAFGRETGTVEELFPRVFALEADLRQIGKIGNYSQFWAWLMLGEIARRVDGRPIDQIIQQELLTPLGLEDTTLKQTQSEWEATRACTSDLFFLLSKDKPHYLLDADGRMSRASAGTFAASTGGFARARDMGRVLEFLAGWNRPAKSPLSRPAIQTMTARHRAGVPDAFGTIWDFGLGLMLESGFYQGNAKGGSRLLGEGSARSRLPDTQSFGSHCSRRTFGHRVINGSVMFADPILRTTVVFLRNTLTPVVSEDLEASYVMADAVLTDLALSAP